MNKVLVFANNSLGLYNFRFELLQELKECGFEVYFCVPEESINNAVQKIRVNDIQYIHTPMNRRGTNPKEDIKLIKLYDKIIREINPDIILTYTIKPNIYGNYVASKYKIPVIMNITGMGTSLSTGKFKFIIKKMYKYACSKSNTIFFQNKGNLNFFVKNNLVDLKKTKLIPGSGVNIDKFIPRQIEKKENKIKFLFIGRLMKDKGIDEYLEVAKNITNKYKNTEFQILGSFEESKYKEILETNKNTRIKYLGKSNDVREEISQVDCIVNPSYHEGMSNVLLEAAAMGKPLIASDIPGCKEIIDDGVNGFLFEVKNVNDLEDKIIKFINLSNEKKVNMGKQSREKVLKEFDRNIVVNEYMKVINFILKGDM